LRYDQDALIEPLGRARDMAGRLRGRADAIGEDELSLVEGDVWAGNAVASSAIEGEMLDMAAVRSAVARRLGATPALSAAAPRNVEGLLDVMNDAAAKLAKRVERGAAHRLAGCALSGRQVGLAQSRNGDLPHPWRALSNCERRGGQGDRALRGPASAAVRAEMRGFLDWFNGSKDSAATDGILRAGLAHLWFESIHPFSHGNGRIGRVIIDLSISQDMRLASRLHGISMELQRRQTDYHAALNHARRGTGDATDWLVWFVGSFGNPAGRASPSSMSLWCAPNFWNQHRNVELNTRQRKALNRMLAAGPGKFEGGMTTAKVHRVDQGQIHYRQPRFGRLGREAAAGTEVQAVPPITIDDSWMGLGAEANELTFGDIAVGLRF